MKNKLLAILMIAAAAMQVACDDNKSSQQKASDCMSDPTCYSMVHGPSGGILFPLGQSMPGTAVAGMPTAIPGQVPTAGTPYGLPTVLPTGVATKAFKSSEALNAMVKQQSVKVAAAIMADDSNPNSPHYQIPTPTNLPTASSASAPSGQAAARDPASQGGGSIEGEAAR